MSRQLDILALEPFYGGPRRSMLEALSRCSRHRWNVLKLPARRMDRRLAVAATWFAEQITRNEIADVDVLFVSEVLNLGELIRMVPWLAQMPSIVYFHDNQLPDNGDASPAGAGLSNITSAALATEVWFNSLYNLRTFLGRASHAVAKHPELQSPNPLPELAAKAQHVPPPVDATLLRDMALAENSKRDRRSLLIDAREANPRVLQQALAHLAGRKEKFRVSVIGQPTLGASRGDFTVLSDRDEMGQIRAMLEAGVVVTARANAASDELAVKAMMAGCMPVAPNAGVYPEVIPASMHARCLHDGTAQSLASRIMDAVYLEYPLDQTLELRQSLEPFDALRACRCIDRNLETMAVGQSV